MRHTDGNVGTTLVNHARGSLAADLVKVLADADEVGGLAVRLALDGIVEAGKGAGGDVTERLSLDGGDEGEDSERELHLD